MAVEWTKCSTNSVVEIVKALLSQSVDDKASEESLLEQWLDTRSDGAGSGRGAVWNQQRPGNRHADIRGIVKDKAGTLTVEVGD